MYTKKYLQHLLKEHNLKGYSHYVTKPELMDLLISKGILERPTEEPKPDQPDPRRRNPQKIKPPPKQVKLTDVETGEITMFPSIYKCSKKLKINSGSLRWHNNKQIAGWLVEICE